jgi:lipopolysaccharide/colanic/teichoic acid biosynthesis glycosyltransferase
MNNSGNSFPSYRSKNMLPLEVGVTTLFSVLFYRFITILIVAIPTILFLFIAWLLADYSQIMSGILLVLTLTIFSLFMFSLFRKKTTPFDKVMKRLVDIIISLSCCISMFPLMVLIALMIKIDSDGPVFARSKRIGKGGKVFEMLRFRTKFIDGDKRQKKIFATRPNNDGEGIVIVKFRHDPRITRLGRILLKTSLDELPQILNVLRGEMSLVGPRPIPLAELEMFDDKYLDTIKSVQPGFTGLWQITGSHGLIDSKIKLDEEYVKNWSLWLDIIILIKTPSAVLRTAGAY